VHRFIHLEPSQGRQRAKLFELGAVLNEQTLEDGGWSMELRMSEKDLRRFLKTENLAEEQLEPAALEPSVTAANE
jgi:GTP-binding protein HflX